jgi:hypothetical protein
LKPSKKGTEMAGLEWLDAWKYKPQERAAAKAAGQTTYFTGRPCKHGHIVLRCTASGACIECSKKSQKSSRTKKLEQNPNWYKENYQKNPEQAKQKAANYRKRNPEKVRQSYLASIKKRKPQKAAAERERIATKLKATPSWLTKDHRNKMVSVYVYAKYISERSGFDCHVDHIVPLKGKTVCGLHVPWNLRVVSRSFNSQKKNNLDDGVLFPPSLSGGVLVHKSALPWNWRK